MKIQMMCMRLLPDIQVVVFHMELRVRSLSLNHMRLMKNSWRHMTGETRKEKMGCMRKMRSSGMRRIYTESGKSKLNSTACKPQIAMV